MDKWIWLCAFWLFRKASCPLLGRIRFNIREISFGRENYSFSLEDQELTPKRFLDICHLAVSYNKGSGEFHTSDFAFIVSHKMKLSDGSWNTAWDDADKILRESPLVKLVSRQVSLWRIKQT